MIFNYAPGDNVRIKWKGLGKRVPYHSQWIFCDMNLAGYAVLRAPGRGWVEVAEEAIEHTPSALTQLAEQAE